jgi:uncharacterized protein YbjT (DUF2867 family)
VDTTKKSAIILGATGLTGGILLQKLLLDERYASIKLFSRSKVGIDHPKLEEHLGNLFELEHFKNQFKADEVYCCIGTTKSKTPEKEVYRKIDYGIPVKTAKLCSQNGIPTLIVISALGASARSSVFYNRIKGEMEEAVLEAGIPKTHLLEPSLIGGQREEKRTGEWVAKQLFKVVDLFLVGPLKKYRSIHPETIAKAMIWVANNTYPKTRIPTDEIVKIANN